MVYTLECVHKHTFRKKKNLLVPVEREEIYGFFFFTSPEELLSTYIEASSA